jgi:hypothetical protein
MSAVKIFNVQHPSRINSAGYPNFSCPYQSPIKLELIVSKTRDNHLSVDITNMVKLLNFGAMYKKFNAHTQAKINFLVGLQIYNI